ncbi:hypothetical protein DS893_02415 [Vibrionales bacterium C3R12]|nr:hypothetical protein DS893_02415 [Vibrionales bacterium C3R12]
MLDEYLLARFCLDRFWLDRFWIDRFWIDRFWLNKPLLNELLLQSVRFPLGFLSTKPLQQILHCYAVTKDSHGFSTILLLTAKPLLQIDSALF